MEFIGYLYSESLLLGHFKINVKLKSSMSCTVEITQDVYGAIDHIHKHGSTHTDCIITEDRDVAEAFLSQIDSAILFLWEKLTSRPKDKNAFAAT